MSKEETINFATDVTSKISGEIYKKSYDDLLTHERIT